MPDHHHEPRRHAQPRRSAEEDFEPSRVGKHTLQERNVGEPLTDVRKHHAVSAETVPWSRAANNNVISDEHAAQDKTRARTIVTGLRAAQHALDTSPEPDAVLRHLAHVGTVSLDYQAAADFDDVWAAADSFDHSLRRVSQRQPARFRAITELNVSIRNTIGLTGASKPHIDAHGSDASYAKAAIGPALDALALRMTECLRSIDETGLHDEDMRRRLVNRAEGDLIFTSTYVHSLIAELPADRREVLAGVEESAARAVGKLLRWVRTRPAHAATERTLLRGVDAFDAVLRSLGVHTIGDRDAAVLTETQQSHAEDETRAFNLELNRAVIAIHELETTLTRNIAAFEHMAELKDQHEPEFVKHTIDGLIEEAAKALVAAPAKAAAGTPLGAVFAVTTGALQSAINSQLATNKSADSSKPPAPSNVYVDARERALVYFCQRLSAAEAARTSEYERNLRQLDGRSALSVGQLKTLHSHVNELEKNAKATQFQVLAQAWAKYLAQSRLKTRSIGDHSVSDMRNYFGKPGEFGSSRAGGDGVLSLLVLVEDEVATHDKSAAKVVGINSELQAALFRAAKKEVARIELPKEILVEARFARARIALDELNRIRAVDNWQEVKPYVRGVTAYDFWHRWCRNLEVS